MDANKPEYDQGLITIPLDNAESIAMTPQQSWQLAEQLRTYLFQHYSQFEPIPLKAINKHGKRFNVAITEHVPFWKKVEKDRWEPHTFRIFEDFLTPQHVYLDIGSWIGPTALYAAQLAKHVYAFEPDPLAYRELETNINANKETEWGERIDIYNQAIAASSGTIKLGSRKRGGDSMSSTLFADKAVSWEVKADTLQQFLEDKKLQNETLFLKIDIEGGEYELLPSIRPLFLQYDMSLYLSVHPFFLAESQPISGGWWAKVLQRTAFVKHHFKLLRSLPFSYLYDIDMQRISPAKQLLKAVLLGDFTHEIIATNVEWKNKHLPV